MNETAIQNALWLHLRLKKHGLVVPNYTPAKWWECDVFSLTEAGMMVEHEIKLTVADFRADVKKAKGFYDNRDVPGVSFQDRWKVTQRTKHECLTLADANGPTRFFYVVPAGMITAADVPEWAGLLHFHDTPQRIGFSIEKDAPKLHRQRCPDNIQRHALSVMYWRYWHLRTRMKPERVAKLEGSEDE